MTYQPPPQNPYWAPQPPPKKPAPWKLIGGITAAVVFLCCGGFLAIGIFVDPPADTAKTGSTAGPLAAPVATSTPAALDEASNSPSVTGTSSPARSSSPATKRSPAATKTSKAASPTPKKTTSKPKPKPTTREPEPEPEEVYYENCTAVRDAGADPIRRGDPGYGRHLDRDGDGVGCE